ncbi:MAG TPA: four helix bundle protein [Cytophagales bacterium]|nr:four helix bundle protein [Cytophagales bacterium]
MEGDKPKDLKERTYDYSVKVIKFIETIEVKEAYKTLIDEVVKSSTSIGANLLEGTSGKSRKEHLPNYQAALKSTNQSKYWLGILKDGLGIDKFAINKLLKEAEELTKLITTGIAKLEKE